MSGLVIFRDRSTDKSALQRIFVSRYQPKSSGTQRQEGDKEEKVELVDKL